MIYHNQQPNPFGIFNQPISIISDFYCFFCCCFNLLLLLCFFFNCWGPVTYLWGPTPDSNFSMGCFPSFVDVWQQFLAPSSDLNTHWWMAKDCSRSCIFFHLLLNLPWYLTVVDNRYPFNILDVFYNLSETRNSTDFKVCFSM